MLSGFPWDIRRSVPTGVTIHGAVHCKCAQKGAMFNGWKPHLARC